MIVDRKILNHVEMKPKGVKFTHKDFTDHNLYISNVPNDMDVNDFFMCYGKYGEIQRIKLLKQYYSSEKYTDLDQIEYFGGAAILQFADIESRVKCLEDQKNHPFIVNENVLFNETDNNNISNYFKRCGFLFFSSSYITNEKINQIFRFNAESINSLDEDKPIQNIEILYPVEFQRPGMAIIEFSTEDLRNEANSDFEIIQSIIEKERNSKEKIDSNDIDYTSIFIQEKNKEAKKRSFSFDINFIIKHILNSNEEFSFNLPSLELEEPSFPTVGIDDDDDDDDDEELIPSIIYQPDRRLCNNPIQFQRWFDFELEFRQLSFKVNSLLASQFSNKIKEQLSTNQIISKSPNHSGFDRFYYSMELDIEGDFQLVVDSLMGQKININPNNAIFLLLCSRELEMDQLNQAVHQLVYDTTDIDMIFQFATQLINAKNKNKIFNNQYLSYYDEKDELVKFYADFLSQNFFNVSELPSFKSLPIDMICKILDKLVYENKKASKKQDEVDKKLSNWIIEFFEKNDNSRVRLIPYISRFLKQLNRTQLTSILSKPGANMNSLRDSISQLISQMNRSKNNISSAEAADKSTHLNDNDNDDDDLVPIISREEESHNCVYDENSPSTSGIFAYIKQKYGNVPDIVEITSPNCFYNIVDAESSSDQYYCSPSIENMWIQFDFSKHPFIIQAYTLRSANQGKCPHLRSWVLEGSNTIGDNCNWIEIDRIENSTFLHNSPHYYTFMVKNDINESYKYIRIRQINSRKNSAEQLILQAIEFYGTLANEDKKDGTILYSRGKEWHGIFNYLTKKYRQNPAEKEVKITSAVDACNLVNPEWSNMHKMWKSANVPNPYVKFDFNCKTEKEVGRQEIKISVEKYLLKTAMPVSYPRSWVVEGSNDGLNWTIIDEVKNNPKISSIWTSYVFTCSNRLTASMHFSQIRIKMTDFNSKGNYYFYLSYIELYGKVLIE